MGEKYGEYISQLLLCNKQAQTILVAYNIYLAHAPAGQVYASVDLMWNVHASQAGWRLTDLSAGRLSSSVSSVDPLLLTASLRVFQAVYPGHVFVMAMVEVQDEGLHCKSQLCVMSAKIPLGKASFKADPEIKGWAYTLIHGCTGELQSHMGKGVDIGRGKNISQNATYLHCSENTSGSALPLAWYMGTLFFAFLYKFL